MSRRERRAADRAAREAAITGDEASTETAISPTLEASLGGSPQALDDERRRLQLRRRGLLAAFALATLAISASFAIGPAVNQREALSLTNEPTWDAERRVQEHLPEEMFGVFLFIARTEGSADGNVLDLDVLQELTRRYDAATSDPEVAPYLDTRYNWQVRRETTTGPWSIAETARDIMDGHSPLALPPEQGGIGWNGSDWNSSTQADLDTLLSVLFNLQAPDPDTGEPTFPYRTWMSEDLAQVEGSWEAGGMFMFATGNRTRLAADYDWEPGGDKPYIESWELAMDAHYEDDMSATGEDVLTYAFAGLNTEIEEEINATSPLVGAAIVLMLIIVGIFFRDWRDLVAVGLGLGLLTVWLTGIRLWLGYPFTQLAAMLPILMLALGVDFAIHSLHRVRRLVGEDPIAAEDRRLAVLRSGFGSVRTLVPALGLATATTAVAFGTAAASPIPDLAEWGVQAVLAIISAYALLGVMVPVLRSGWRLKEEVEHTDDTVAKLRTRVQLRIRGAANTFERRGWFVLAAFALITVGTFWIGVPTSDFDARDYIDNDARVIQTMDANSRTFENTGEPNYYLIESADGLTDPASMHAISRLHGTILSEDLEPRGVTGLPEMMRMQLALAAAGGGGTIVTALDNATGLPTDEADIVAVLEDLARNGTRDALDPVAARIVVTPGDVSSHMQFEDGELLRMRLWFRVADAEDWNGMADLLVDLEAFDDEIAALSGVDITITGPSYTRYVYVNAITESFSTSIYIAIALCAIILLVALRRPWLAILTVLPVLAVTAWLQAGMVVAGLSLNIVTVQVASLAIGLGIDYSIHVTQRLREARRTHPAAGRTAWMREVMSETGVALAASATSTFTGFLLLLGSPMPLFTMFGMIMAIMIALSLVAAMVMLPPLLLKLGGLPYVEDLDSELVPDLVSGLRADAAQVVAGVGARTGLGRVASPIAGVIGEGGQLQADAGRTHLAAAAAMAADDPEAGPQDVGGGQLDAAHHRPSANPSGGPTTPSVEEPAPAPPIDPVAVETHALHVLGEPVLVQALHPRLEGED